MAGPSSRLERIVSAGRFAVTSDVGAGRTADGSFTIEQARDLVGYADAVNVGDNPLASPHLSAMAEAALVARAGLEPILQLTCRDRNRIGLTSDLLGGWALGARNLLCLTGDPVSAGDHPDAVGVNDLTVLELVSLARKLRDEGRTLAGVEVDSPPRYFIGVADSPLAEPYDPARLEAKLDAGAMFVQTQIAYDVERLAAWAEGVRARGILERAAIFVGLAPLHSLRTARWMNDRLPGVTVPDELLQALEEAGPEGEAEVGIRWVTDVARSVREIEGIAGLHVMGLGHETAVRRVIEGAGLFPRPVFDL